MALLPIETWRHIIKNHMHKTHWVDLATTCSFFHLIFREILYESITLVNTNGNDKDNEGNLALGLFARSLKERPELATLVRRLCILYECNAYQEDPPLFYCYRNHPILCNLHLFSKLTHLEVADFLIGSPFLSGLRSHPRLSNIRFTACKLSALTSNTHNLESLSATLISDVVRDNPHETSHRNSGAVIVPTSICSLQFNPVDPMFVGGMLEALGVTQTLTGLSIGMTYTPLPTIVSILSSSSQLRRLTLRGVHTSRAVQPSSLDALTFDSIPLLEEFTGPAEFLEAVVPGRPVHSVTLKFDDDNPIDILLILQHSAMPVTNLIVMGRRDDMERDHKYLMHAPTSIVFFGWESHLSNKHAELCCPALSRLTSLAVIRGSTTGPAEDEIGSHRTDIVHKFSNACPSIKEFDFLRERWLARKDGSWERYQ